MVWVINGFSAALLENLAVKGLKYVMKISLCHGILS